MQEEMTPTQQKRPKEITLERLRMKHPDKDFEDEDARYGQLNDDYDELESNYKTMKEQEQKLVDMFSSDPRSAGFFLDWREGGDPVSLLIKRYGKEIVESLQDPERQEELAKAQQEYLERLSKEKELDELYKTNLAESFETLEKLQNEDGLSEDDCDKAIAFLVKVVNDGLLGKFSKESILMAINAIRYDTDVEVASQEGEIRGKNQKYEQQKLKRKEGDGLPAMGGKPQQTAQHTRPANIFELARLAQ